MGQELGVPLQECTADTIMWQIPASTYQQLQQQALTSGSNFDINVHIDQVTVHVSTGATATVGKSVAGPKLKSADILLVLH